MDKPQPYNENYKGTKEQHFNECLEYSKETGKAIPLLVFKSLGKDTTRYLMAIKRMGFKVLDN